MSKKVINEKEFKEIIKDLLENETVKQMKKYKQHYDVTTYEHCVNVSFLCYKMCKRLNLDYVSAARAGMLHDLFLYDWHEKRPHKKFTDLHAFAHPKIALKNAEKITKLNKKEKDIIVKHMWPVTLSLPRYRESFIITIADKMSTLKESFRHYTRKRKKR